MIIADLHIHSKYSRATSGDCVPEHLDLWARRKGIDLLGTGDFTHPAWREELREKLSPAEDGLFVLKDGFRLKDETAGGDKQPRFVLSGEISSIYKKNGRVRKVHNLILLPGLEAAEMLSQRLEAIGNLHSDGRPILGLDSRDLLEITLEACPEAVFIPAHIWTPHFSLFGAFSGFDTIEECFGDMTPYIHALETGLSSDPPMNWRLSALDNYLLVSNSDAHSPAKLGREANLLDAELSYPSLARALGGKGGLAGTLEFFPEEGKYHLDGHRNCQVCLKPVDTKAASGVCPVCGGKITIGVLHRVEQLADRAEGFTRPHPLPFESLVPLPEVLASSTGLTPTCKKVQAGYAGLLHALGPEFYILRQAPLEDIRQEAGPCVAEGIRRMRLGEVRAIPGFDGEFGKIMLLDQDEIDALSGQLRFFAGEQKSGERIQKTPVCKKSAQVKAPAIEEKAPASDALAGLNGLQRQAVTAPETAVSVVAGPGTGKTKTLVSRIAWLVAEKKVKPSEITAVTFTNKAARELRERLEQHFGGKRAVKGMTIGTFHSICLELLSGREGGVTLIDEYEAQDLAAEVLAGLSVKRSPRKLLECVSRQKNGDAAAEADDFPAEACERYREQLKAYGVLDFDDLLLEALALFSQPAPESLKPFTHLLVDEFQDINGLQYRLIQAWAQKCRGLFVIGDPDQSIYGFRGSDARCFERFWEDHPGARQIRLTQNYRSTPEILGCALPVIARNPGPERLLETQRPSGALVRLLTGGDELSEGIFAAKEINRMVGGIDMLDAGTATGKQRGFSDIALLYRTHRQAETLEYCLRKEGIPYVVAGRDKLLADPWVRGAVCFFRALLAPGDLISLRACLRTVFDCPAELIRPYLAARGQGTEPAAQPESPGLRRWEEFSAAYAPRVHKEKPRKLLESWIADLGLSGSAPLERLLHMAVFQKDMPSFLQNLTLGREIDLMRSGSRSYLSDAVTLMTLHGAKGLEFPVVFLCGARKGVLPLESPGRETAPEEERRLFYVGITRAREELLLLTSGEPSPFLPDLPADQLEAGPTVEKKKASGGKQLSLFDF